MLTYSTNVHGEKVIDGLRVEPATLSSARVAEVSRNTEDQGAGLADSLDVNVATKATECGFDFLKQLMRNRICA